MYVRVCVCVCVCVCGGGGGGGGGINTKCRVTRIIKIMWVDIIDTFYSLCNYL